MIKSTNQQGEELHFLRGGGEMGALIRAYDWRSTPLGSPRGWPKALKTSVGIMLGSPYPMFVWWGPEMIMFHNDAYVPILGKRHPEALGKSGRAIWSDVWDFIGPLMDDVLNRGQACYFEKQLLTPERKGYREETYFTFSYSPIPGEHGGAGGIFCVCSEDTGQVLNQRRMSTLRDLSELTVSGSMPEVFERSSRILSGNPNDLPFGLFYKVTPDGKRAERVGAFGIPADAPAAPPTIELEEAGGLEAGEQPAWPLSRVIAAGNSAVVLEDLSGRFPSLPAGPWEESPSKAIILPVKKSAQDQLVGFLVCGISPRLAFDEDYKSFLGLVALQLSTAIANVSVLEEERERMKKLLALDKAKTDFFSNVSHEFRTPLTLMLGPLEEMAAEKNESFSQTDRARLQTVYQNSLRLLKQVNTLLDFSRVEAQRMQAVYRPTDLCRFTAELAGAFQSATQKAGLAYEVSCAPLSEPVYVDPGLWEKIVLNLVSNAFKFTLEGKISVVVDETPAHAVLRVQDTGVGIPAEELPNVFKRFHRVPNTRSRSYEGTGIGLALAKELVALHGGTIEVTSAAGRGTTFTVRIPKGTAHLDPARISGERYAGATAGQTEPYVTEARLWEGNRFATGPAPEETSAGTAGAGGQLPPDKQIRILLVDDNADMLRYLERLVSPYYTVETAKDGVEALAAVRLDTPDLIVSDVMMPNLNGFELLSEIRKDRRTSHVPVILLSARAGEEATVEGLESGANDYLIKPFSARELLSRVRTQLELSRTRQDNQRIKEAEEELKKFKVISDYAFDAFILMRSDGTFAYLNDLALKRWGYTREEARTIRVPDVDPIYQEEEFNAVFALAQQQGALPPFETIHQRKDGTTYPVEVSMGSIILEGKPHLFAVARDITERKGAEESLKRKNEQLTRINNDLDNFIYTASHDLKAPIVNIEGLMKVLERRIQPLLHEDETVKGMIDMMNTSIGRFKGTITDLTDIARIQKQLEEEPEQVKLEEVLADTELDLRQQILESGARIETHMVDCPGLFFSRKNLKSIVYNLLSNALKYRDPARPLAIDITCRQEPGYLVLQVEDNGLGMDTSNPAKIFGMFKRMHVHVEGTGIGLYIVKKIVENAGGRIELESRVGVGSSFRVYLKQ